MISRLIQGALVELDIPPELRNAATKEYRRVGNWLAEHHDQGNGWAVYPQGSFLLNTVVLPVGRDEYDIDLVCLRAIELLATTKKKLKAEVGEALADYVEAVSALPDGPIKREEGKRCWTLLYNRSRRFHLDILPAIPNRETDDGILITDRQLHEWQRSNPLAYARWFRSQAEAEFLTKRARLAEAERVPPQEIPEWEVKTTLQTVVQALKLHRNEYFCDLPKMRPASILLTTLAARAYRGERDLYGALLETVEFMPQYVGQEHGLWAIPNPVEPRENFADRWSDRPELANHFWEWLDRLGEDLRDVGSRDGIDRVASRLQESFGREPIEKSAGRLGDAFLGRREAGVLTLAPATGVLSTGPGVPVRNHGFYGGSHRP